MSDTPTPASLTFNQQERDAIRKAQEAARVISERVGRPQDAPLSPMAARENNEPVVFVAVAKAFKLNLDHHRVVEFPVGNYLCPVRIATAWWAVNNGITILSSDDIKLTLPLADLSVEERAQVLRARAEKTLADAHAAIDAAQVLADAAEADALKAEAEARGEKPTE